MPKAFRPEVEGVTPVDPPGMRVLIKNLLYRNVVRGSYEFYYSFSSNTTIQCTGTNEYGFRTTFGSSFFIENFGRKQTQFIYRQASLAAIKSLYILRRLWNTDAVIP